MAIFLEFYDSRTVSLGFSQKTQDELKTGLFLKPIKRNF